MSATPGRARKVVRRPQPTAGWSETATNAGCAPIGRLLQVDRANDSRVPLRANWSTTAGGPVVDAHRSDATPSSARHVELVASQCEETSTRIRGRREGLVTLAPRPSAFTSELVPRAGNHGYLHRRSTSEQPGCQGQGAPMTSQEEPTSSRGRAIEARPRPGWHLGVTLMGALAPGSGYLFIGRRLLGLAVLMPTLLLVGAGAWYFGRDLDTAIDVAFDPARLKIVAAALTVGLLAWATVLVSTYLMVRPAQRTRVQTFLGGSFVVVLVCLRGRPGRDRRALRHGAGRPRVHHLRAQPERHRATGRERGGPLGRPSPGERPAARRRRRPGSRTASAPTR